MSTDALRATLRVTKALADPQRLRILMMLEPGELCVCQIVEVLGLAPSTVSKHLSILAAADLVMSRKAGRWAYYRLPDGPQAFDRAPLMDWLHQTLADDPAIGRDAQTLQSVMDCDPGALSRKQRGASGESALEIDPGRACSPSAPQSTSYPEDGASGESALPVASHPKPTSRGRARSPKAPPKHNPTQGVRP